MLLILLINVKIMLYYYFYLAQQCYIHYICIVKIKQQYNGNTEIQQE